MKLFKNLFISQKTNKKKLIGKWKCIKLNNAEIIVHGFQKIELEFFKETFTVSTKFQNFETESISMDYTIDDELITINFQKDNVSKFQIFEDNIIFMPDLFFDDEIIKKSEYIKVS